MHFKCNETHWEFAKHPTEAIGTIFRNIFLLGVCLGRVWGAELSVRWVKLSPFINCDYVRWPRDIGKCIQRSCVIFGLFLIPISWISANFCLRIIFHQWMMMEDLGRWWKTMEDDLWTLENVLKGLVSSLDRFWYPWVEFLWIFIWGSSSINGRWWKMMEDDRKWWKMYCHIIYNTFDIL